MIPGELYLNQQNRITFPLVDATNTEVSGLGNTFALEISKDGGAFAASGGTKAEISNGWYSYLTTAGECDTPGPVSIRITGAGIIQQNLEYMVITRVSGAAPYTYTVINSVTTNPIPDVTVWVTTDIAGNNVIWNGITDAFGVARDVNDNLPYLEPGTYFFWKHKIGFIDDDNPDTEVAP